MRKILVIFLLCLPLLAKAQGAERIFVSTDRDIYISGDDVWCSLFCFDRETGHISSFSAVAYVELISAQGTAATAKISLLDGRGAGKFIIPASTPTGNYSVVAYTALNVNEDGRGWFAGAKTVSVFNTTSAARVPGGVVAVEESAYGKGAQKEEVSSPELTLSFSGTGAQRTLNLTNRGGDASLCLSVYRVDDIVSPENRTMAGFLEGLKAEPAPVLTQKRLPEYEGEIIYAAVEGLKKDDGPAGQSLATLSSAGSPSDVYIGKVLENGRIVFFTNNIYGDRELVCSLSDDAGYISLLDNFIHPEPEQLPALEVSRAQYSSLVTRKAALAAAPQVDTLEAFLRRRQDGLLPSIRTRVYHLDDYNRFNTLEEVLIEIVGELSLRKHRGVSYLEMVVQNPVTGKKSIRENIIIMLDGVVIPNLSLIENIDAMLLEDIVLYMDYFAMGSVSFDGAVNFITGKDYVKALRFPEGTRVTDFKGVSYPMSYRGSSQLLLWEPLLQTKAGETKGFTLSVSSPGNYRVVAQGLNTDGTPLYSVFGFEIK